MLCFICFIISNKIIQIFVLGYLCTLAITHEDRTQLGGDMSILLSLGQVLGGDMSLLRFTESTVGW